MKATDLLRTQHREARELMGRIDAHTSAREAEAVVRELATVLGAHMMIEQEMFYPACALGMGDRELARHGFEEHAEVAEILRGLLAMAGDDPAFRAQLKKLRENIEHHVGEEERGLFLKAEPILGDKDLEVLGGRMEARFDEGVELGYEVTTAEGAVDMNDVDHILAQYEPTGQRMVPAVPGDRATIKTVPAAVRHAAARIGVEKPERSGGRRHPKSGASGARKTREGNRGS